MAKENPLERFAEEEISKVETEDAREEQKYSRLRKGIKFTLGSVYVLTLTGLLYIASCLHSARSQIGDKAGEAIFKEIEPYLPKEYIKQK